MPTGVAVAARGLGQGVGGSAQTTGAPRSGEAGTHVAAGSQQRQGGLGATAPQWCLVLAHWGAGLTQAPRWQTLPARWQLMPHAPQLRQSSRKEAMVRHWPLQRMGAAAAGRGRCKSAHGQVGQPGERCAWMPVRMQAR